MSRARPRAPRVRGDNDDPFIFRSTVALRDEEEASAICTSKHRNPVPDLGSAQGRADRAAPARPRPQGRADKAARMLSISLCKGRINTLHRIRRCGLHVPVRGTGPVFPWPAFRGGAGLFMADLNYGIRFVPDCQPPWPALPHRPVRSGVTQSIPEPLALRSDSDGRPVCENKHRPSEESPFFFYRPPRIESRGSAFCE